MSTVRINISKFTAATAHLTPDELGTFNSIWMACVEHGPISVDKVLEITQAETPGQCAAINRVMELYFEWHVDHWRLKDPEGIGIEILGDENG